MADGAVNLTIDGMPVSVPPGTLVIEAAKQAGVLVPHYCYHPGLPVAGVCRMCLVQVENAPKLQIACATQVTEGMVVHTQSEPAKSARMGVLELLLINHPLDCPICDQAGECELQDFTFQEGRPATRYSPDYAKRFNPVEDFGPDVLYVPNRCILCTRCVRFMEDVAQEPVLNVSERGDRAYIGIHPDARLDHPWAGNVVDLCPVGSLLSKDFLHKARAWELDKSASVCTGCTQGCNVTLDVRDNVIVRVRPRPNLEVNRYFICDHGRMNYRWMNRGDRIEAPLVKQDGELRAVDWDEALDRARTLLRGTGGGAAVAIVSPKASTEALFLARRVLAGKEREHEWTGAFQGTMGEGAPLAGGVAGGAGRAGRGCGGVRRAGGDGGRFRGAVLGGVGRDGEGDRSGRGGAGVTFFLVSSIIKIVGVFTAIMVGVALLTLAERRICAWMQDRLGPNRVGPQGLLQPAADGLKNFLKEETYPAQADFWTFVLAPALSFTPALLTFAVIPFAAPLPTQWGLVPMVVADLPVGFLYILAISSLGVYGIVLAGWSSNHKYALLRGLRASAQMISYEIPMGMRPVAGLVLARKRTPFPGIP